MGYENQAVPQPRFESSNYRLALLGGFELSRQGRLMPDLTAGAQRLLAFLALRERSVTRMGTADSLWPNASEEHAHSSLRSTIARLPPEVQESVLVGFHDLRLAARVDVDLREARALAHRLLDAGAVLHPMDLQKPSIQSLAADLLPDWDDDWAIAAAEGWHQLRLYALEAMAGHLAASGRFGDATNAALLAIQADPLRETARAVIVRIHLAEGNQSEALAAFAQYRSLLRAELGLEPTALLSGLVTGLSS
jgi:DNA-binding SARP family transcriptional activator